MLEKGDIVKIINVGGLSKDARVPSGLILGKHVVIEDTMIDVEDKLFIDIGLKHPENEFIVNWIDPIRVKKVPHAY